MRILRCQVEHGESMVKFMGNPQMSVPNIELIWLMFVIQHTFFDPKKNTKKYPLGNHISQVAEGISFTSDAI